MRSAISLSELNQEVSSVVNRTFSEGAWIKAEISTIQERGHCYLELIEKEQDTDAIVARANANIWRSVYVALRIKFVKGTGVQLAAGMKVLVFGRPTFHPQYGYSINITDIDPEYTAGDAALRRAAIVRRLKEEGVYELNKELEVPQLIRRIAIVSASGAAGYGDFMNQLASNTGGYKYKTELFEALMQGESAESSIIAALDRVAQRSGDFDVVAIIRGGGAATDLSCYDRYDIAFAVAQFPLPVITGIGHDRDVSIVDEVACLHLKTPTAVASFIIESSVACEMRLNNIAQSLNDIVKQYINLHRSKIEIVETNLAANAKMCLESHRHKLEMVEQVIELASPQNVLKRGYSMTMSGERVITKASELKEGETLTTILSDGKINSIIIK
ncbi:MAG: exodeoxyribonuclease VII large subunit [Paludibacteraceae bacterium]|nr:exodeoxyribonuclease VII large subunit [Paludibacteraceae bacterium]